MAKCSVCGFKVTSGVTKCPMCGASIVSKKDNNATNSGDSIFTIGNINMDVFDVICIVALGIYTLMSIINLIGSLLNSYSIVYTLLNGVYSILYCVSFWGLFVYYKTKEKLFKLIEGIIIIASIFFLFLNYVIMFFETGYVTFWNLISNVFVSLVQIAVPYILIVLKNKDERNNINL